jgi:hypothetical protein
MPPVAACPQVVEEVAEYDVGHSIDERRCLGRADAARCARDDRDEVR